MSHRVFAGTLAAVFFLTAFGFSFVVIWTLIHNKSSSSPSSSQTANTSPANSPSQQKSLVGTKLSGFTPVTNVTSLKITDTKVGTGAVASANSTVTVLYTGAVAATGIIFQTTSDTGQPVQFNLSSVIPGWEKGIPGMRVGGTRQLLIPASEAYGANPPSGSGIPPNAALVFDVTLLGIK